MPDALPDKNGAGLPTPCYCRINWTWLHFGNYDQFDVCITRLKYFCSKVPWDFMFCKLVQFS